MGGFYDVYRMGGAPTLLFPMSGRLRAVSASSVLISELCSATEFLNFSKYSNDGCLDLSLSLCCIPLKKDKREGLVDVLFLSD